jgi:uncharacterized membrane protein YvbJ
MAYCSACGSAISDEAKFCDKCGHSVGSSIVTTIEQTGKKWKKLSLIGAALVVGGIIVTTIVPPLGALMLLAGIAVLVYTSFGKWWHHG